MWTASAWAAPIVWAVLYCSDYFMTITCARMYGKQDKVRFQGSYEITPIFQADVNALRRVSPRFLTILLASTIYVLFLGMMLQATEFHALYLFAVGALILIQLTVHVRHFRNWFLFRSALAGHGLTGRLEYGRDVVLRASAFELGEFALLYALIFVMTPAGPFVLGGAVACAFLSLTHYRLARRQVRAVESSQTRES